MYFYPWKNFLTLKKYFLKVFFSQRALSKLNYLLYSITKNFLKSNIFKYLERKEIRLFWGQIIFNFSILKFTYLLNMYIALKFAKPLFKHCVNISMFNYPTTL